MYFGNFISTGFPVSVEVVRRAYVPQMISHSVVPVLCHNFLLIIGFVAVYPRM